MLPAAISVAVAGVLLGSVSATVAGAVGVMVGRVVGATVAVAVGATVAAVEGATVGAVVGASVVCAVRGGVFVRSAAALRSMPPRSARSARTRTRIAGTIARRQGNPPRAFGGAITAVAAPPATVDATRIGSAAACGGGSTRATPLTRPDADNSGDGAPSTGVAAMTAAAAIGGCDGLVGGGKVVGAGVGTENCEPASARTKAPDRAKRSSGFFASARRSAASTPGGSATPSWLGSGTGLFTWAISAERGLSDGNGWRPTSIWYAMIPSAYWSAAGPALSAPPASSGAM